MWSRSRLSFDFRCFNENVKLLLHLNRVTFDAEECAVCSRHWDKIHSLHNEWQSRWMAMATGWNSHLFLSIRETHSQELNWFFRFVFVFTLVNSNYRWWHNRLDSWFVKEEILEFGCSTANVRIERAATSNDAKTVFITSCQQKSRQQLLGYNQRTTIPSLRRQFTRSKFRAIFAWAFDNRTIASYAAAIRCFVSRHRWRSCSWHWSRLGHLWLSFDGRTAWFGRRMASVGSLRYFTFLAIHCNGNSKINIILSGDHANLGHPIGLQPHHPVMEPEHKVLAMPDDGSMDDDNGEHQAEQPCDLACVSTDFLCSRSCMCVPKFTRCDEEINCEDGEDEEDCTISNEEIIKTIKNECESTEKHVMCPRTFACIAQEFLCDGDDDCGDYSDETHCGAHVNCSDDQFECANGLCIQHPWVCDGDNDCKDYSDEVNCTKTTWVFDTLRDIISTFLLEPSSPWGNWKYEKSGDVISENVNFQFCEM